MASAVYTESQTHLTPAAYTDSHPHPERRPLSICLDIPASSSPFPSPSSSFLPPPMPGAHEFAVKPAPAGRNGRKPSLVPKEDEALPPDAKPAKSPDRLHSNGTAQYVHDSTLSPTTPTPRDTTLLTPAPPLPSQKATPTPTTAPLPQSPSPASTSFATSISNTSQPPRTPTTPLSPSFHANPPDVTPSPTPNRPAPPSPDVSRRVSAISTASARSKSSRSSRPPSAAVSRANSTRKSNALSHLSQQQQLATPTKSTTIIPSPLPSPRTFAFTAAHAGVAASVPRTLVHVRDFAYERTDERFEGLGPDVPKANRVARLNRKLRGSVGSYESSEDGDEDEDGEDEDAGVDAAWDRLRGGWKGMGFTNGYAGGSGNGPSQAEMDLNFCDGAEEGEEEEDEEVYYDPEGEEPLYPGLYRAMYAFQPEGTGEMALDEDQIVRVIGRGGGVGWAVVLDENADTPEKHALVPESYLEAVRLDGEEEEEEAEPDA
ncbi:hypothetical protein FPV67DRAFT_1648894 [Lyophyllum atratum]|nr:hypothetical protein FPV67DRAFT_1648894 [Lyophyllum atratum]